MKVDHDTYRVTWSAEDGEHVGLCAEFPSLTWLANTPEAALAGIREAVGQVVADMRPTRCRQSTSRFSRTREHTPGKQATPLRSHTETSSDRSWIFVLIDKYMNCISVTLYRYA